MHVRQMTCDDIPQVMMIENELFTDAWTEAGFVMTLEQKTACFLVGEIQGKVIGYCGFYQALDEAEIVNVAVAKAEQNQGYGKCLVAQLLEEGRKKGVRYFVLEVRINNASARHMYEKLGFCELGIRKNFYDHPIEDAVIMQLENIIE